MKTTLLAVTAMACLATSGIAMVFAEAEKPTTSPGSETVRGQGGAITDMDEVGRDSDFGRQENGELFNRLDINNDGFLNPYELGALEAPDADDEILRARGRELMEKFDQNGNEVVAPEEFKNQMEKEKAEQD